MAQEAGKSTEAFEDFYFDVCTFDYSKMAAACEPLKKLMEQTDKVRLVGPGTDLSFFDQEHPGDSRAPASSTSPTASASLPR